VRSFDSGFGLWRSFGSGLRFREEFWLRLRFREEFRFRLRLGFKNGGQHIKHLSSQKLFGLNLNTIL